MLDRFPFLSLCDIFPRTGGSLSSKVEPLAKPQTLHGLPKPLTLGEVALRSNDGEGEPGKGLNAMFNLLNKKDRTPPALPQGTVRRRYSIEGQVQGVGFRYRARYAAQTLELTGWVENEDDGSVTLEVQGDPDKFMRLFAMIQKSDYIRITGIRQKDLPPDPWERGFSVRGY